MFENAVKICVESAADTLLLHDNNLCASVNGKRYEFPINTVQQIILLTTDQGPIEDDLEMVIDVGCSTVICIMSEHGCFKPFLFRQIGDVLPIDYHRVIDACSCTDDHAFEIYRRE